MHSPAGSDFTAPHSFDVTFYENGPDRMCFTFSIIDDNCVEDKESFGVVLSTSDADVEIHISSANVTIIDNDSKDVKYSCLSNSSFIIT